MVELFNDGGWAMYPLLILLILGIGVAIERLHNLSRAAIDAESFFKNLEEAINSGGPDKAAELCSATPGPVASVIHAGLWFAVITPIMHAIFVHLAHSKWDMDQGIYVVTTRLE
mgnify:CR=1 FL=1